MTTVPASQAVTADAERRSHWARIGRWCAFASLAWTTIEAVASVWVGQAADSIALMGFGIDSIIETISAVVVVWRLSAERHGDAARAARVEKTAGRWMAALLILLAGYIAVESVRRLVGHGPEAAKSTLGMALMAAALVVMTLLYLAKRRVARELDSAIVRADGIQSLACCWLAVATFIGLALNAALGWSSADPLAGLVLIPFIIKEARAAWKGEGCGCSPGHTCS